MSEITVRISDGRSCDIDAIAELEKQCFSVPWSWKSIAEEITENENARFYVAESDGRFAGCASCWVLIPYECQLGNVAVMPEMRRQGVAKKLLERLIDDAEKQGLLDITLEVRVSNAPAIALYKSLGFEQEGIRKRYYEGKEDAVIMWRREKLKTR